MCFALSIVVFALSCGGTAPATQVETAAQPTPFTNPFPEKPTPKEPDTRAELLSPTFATTDSAIGKYDFKNHSYELPRGWQNADGNEITLENGRRRATDEKIGASFVTTKFFDVTGDGNPEALVVIVLETGGSALPQMVYVFQWKGGKPEMIWNFRTGDRSDGGLKNLIPKDGMLSVELYGQDRYIFGQMETMKIAGDEEPLCCPKFFTRSFYKFNGSTLKLEGNRLTFPVDQPDAAPLENLNDVRTREESNSHKHH